MLLTSRLVYTASDLALYVNLYVCLIRERDKKTCVEGSVTIKT